MSPAVGLELQPGIHMTALRTLSGRGSRILRVERVAPDAMKGDLFSTGVIKSPIAPVVIYPEEAENAENEDAIDDEIKGGVRRRHD
jgi:hypothetical protein